MITLNQTAENIAYKLGDQFNTTLQESIKLTILTYRAKFIRDDLAKNFTSDVHFNQTGILQFEIVDLLKEFGSDFSSISAICDDLLEQQKYKVLKSVKKVPIPIRTKNSGNSLYSFIGSMSGIKRFVYTTIDKFYFYKQMDYTTKSIYYTVINGHIYVLNNLDECDVNESLGITNVMIKDVFENPSDFYNACENADKFADDMEFPIGMDMLMQIENNILKGEFPLKPKDGQQINIKPDDNN